MFQGEASYAEVDEQKNCACSKVQKVVKDKLKISMPYVCQDQASAPAFCEVQPQCSSGIEELQISADQGEQVTEKESWWSCPWCDFRIDSEPTSRSDAKPCRWRAKHLLNEHPQKNHDAPEAKVTKKREG